MHRLTVVSPAKLNLVLDVVKKRPDGFHEIRTIFERISLVDQITLTRNKSGKISLRCVHPHVPKGPGNLAFKAAMMLFKDFSISEGLDINITKNIPVAAGLGGGSSNAAAVLLGLNRLWKIGLNNAQLAGYAARLGSDVAFFLYDTSYALGSGRGELIRQLDVKAKLWHVLVTPRVKMYTKEVFARLGSLPETYSEEPRLDPDGFQQGTTTKRSRSTTVRRSDAVESHQGKPNSVVGFGETSILNLTNKKDNVNILLPFLKKGDLTRLAGALSNDLEPVILSLRPNLIYIKSKLLDAGATGVCFSGSGPSVFACVESQGHAESLRAKFDRRYTQVFVVSTL